ncbi:MAG: BspA family leucine-rich repeat surface protein [Balneolaceae bacterium]|nr:BspA family leucine-rich repeat surface protein [Balneolaceae bacterium]
MFAFFTGVAEAQSGFITIWNTENSGASTDNQITIPTTGSGYNYNVTWEKLDDVSVNGTESGITGNLTLTFDDPGEYKVEITGDFPRIYFNNEGDRLKIISIEQWGNIEWSSMAGAFYGASNLVINAEDAPDLSNVESLSQMFRDATSINSDLDWDVSNVKNMSAMFFGASLFNGDISGWDVSKVENMSSMFTFASAFNSNISLWEVGKVEFMNAMFQGASSFNQDISGWDVSSATGMSQIFHGASSFNQDISGWETGNVTNMNQMLINATSFNQNLGQLDISGVTNMSSMLSNTALSLENYDNTLNGWASQSVQDDVTLGANNLEYCTGHVARQALIDSHNWSFSGDAAAEGCSPFITTWKTDNTGTSTNNQITIPITGTGYDFAIYWGDGNFSFWQDGDDPNDLTHTYTSAGEYIVHIIGDFRRIFFNNGGDRQKILSVDQWGDIQWGTMDRAFYGASNLVINATDAPDLSGVTTLGGMFQNATSLNSDLNHWDVSNVTNMSSVFSGAESFNGDISSWDVRNVTSMNFTFMGATSFDSDISEWDVSAVTSMSSMFNGASAFNQNISTWETESVDNMNGMFINATSFDQNIGGWNVSNVIYMGGMFRNASAFNQDISGWKTDSVTEINRMFDGATSFNQDISGWNVSNVTKMDEMFQNAASFNQNLGDWDISNVDDMEEMLSGSGLSVANYDATLIGWASQSVQNEVPLGATDLQYCNGGTARQKLIDDHVWNITGDAEEAGCEPAGIMPDSDNILYVLKGGVGLQTGDSWANALPELADALKWAHENKDEADKPWDDENPLQIWVASGTYKPMYHVSTMSGDDPLDLNNTFLMVIDTQIYGGFEGSESALEERNYAIHQTILSGDLDDDGESSEGDAYHVVVSAGDVGTARLDGVIITIGGNSAAPNSSLTVNGQTVNRRNGGGLVINNSSPVIANVVMDRNYGHLGGGVFNHNGGSPVFVNVQFTNNTAVSGGAIYNNSNSLIVNSTISQNEANFGGGIYNGSTLTLNNSIIWGNSANSEASDLFNTTTASAELNHSLYSDDTDDLEEGGGVTVNNGVTSNPEFADVGNDIFTLTETSPAIVAGSNSLYTAAGGDTDTDTDLAGNPRVMNGTIDMGAFEFQGVPQPGAPMLTSPANGAVDVDIPATLEWEASAGADNYRVQVTLSGGSFGDAVFDDTTADTDIEVAGLDELTEYDWRVQALADPDVESDWSDVWSFTTGENPEPPTVTLRVEFSGDGAGAVTSDPAGIINCNSDATGDCETEVPFEEPGIELMADADAGSIFTGWCVQSDEAGSEEFCFDSSVTTVTFLPVEGELDPGTVITATAGFAIQDVPEGKDQRILASNRSTYIFSGADFGVANAEYSVKIETLPGQGQLQFNGTPVTADQLIPVSGINNGDLAWVHNTDDHGYNYTTFEFRIVSDEEVESEGAYTMAIDLAATSVVLSDNAGEGWRFLTSPATGDTFAGFLSSLYTQGIPGSVNPGTTPASLYKIDQEAYAWDNGFSMSDEIGVGVPFIIYAFEDDLTAELLSGEEWAALAGDYQFPGLWYDTNQGDQGDSHFLIANPHPISLDFCEFAATHVSPYVDIWNPALGDGDYQNLVCGIDDVHIAPFQAFWVRTTADNPELVIPETAYLQSTANGYFKKIERSAMSDSNIVDSGNSSLIRGDEKGVSILALTVAHADKNFKNTVRILFNDEGTFGLDPYDAPKLSPAGLARRWLSFYAMDGNNQPYALRSLPSDFGDQITVPLDIRTTETGNFILTWSLSEISQFSGKIYLRDNHTGSLTELREEQSHLFEIDEYHAAKAIDSPLERGDARGVSLTGILHSSVHGKWTDEEVPRFELILTTQELEVFGDLPSTITLNQNYPNPFNPTTVISYELPQTEQVRLDVFDMTGRHVVTLAEGQVSAGSHTVTFDARNLSSGVYMYRLVAGGTVMTRQLTLIK